ncbi:hypothetical protein D9758_007869 [Tetrapyrgos nigripes]|uniref:(2E,6E)-farnesyl diphosphate synthase n=1 Tax=Tetrapyrgos nigripes TaxID=182062 RepID=A0A8H5D4E9_9AGAR|nr:hypothetical protein D9758_007869 [Tetrapyrgos nigripes]
MQRSYLPFRRSIPISRFHRSINSVSTAAKCTPRPDPFALVAPQLAGIRDEFIHLLGSAHPGLDDIAKYYFLRPSKQLRPLLVLLFSQATNGLGKHWPAKRAASGQARPSDRVKDLDRPLSRPDVLNDWNPRIPDKTTAFSPSFSLHPLEDHSSNSQASSFDPLNSTPSLVSPSIILPTQERLAQIVEMVHAASLLHDDVIDESPLRRGTASAPEAFGNKLSVLGGNFILGRASTALARLGDPEATELIASVIANLVEGEILQMQDVKSPEKDTLASSPVVNNAWTIYLQKTYMKTASLMAKGVRAAVVLGGCTDGEVYKEVAYAYGRNLGIAFQLVDDILDYESADDALGKPGGADLQLGLTTGPALYAWEEYPELGPLIHRKFNQQGDVELARELVRKSSGVQRTRDLALAYANQAREVLKPLPDSDAKAALGELTERVIKRKS